MLGRDGRPCFLDRHLRRLAGGAARLGVGPVPDVGTLEPALRRLMVENGLERGLSRLRITAVPGTVLVTATALSPYPATAAVVTSPFVRNERDALAGIKATSYAGNLVALREARERGADEAILANTRGELCEGATSNLFLVRRDGCLITPPLASGCLPGVMREVVLERCRERGIEVREESGPPADLATCREAFLTSSLRGVQGIVRIDERELPAPGEVTLRLRQVPGLAPSA